MVALASISDSYSELLVSCDLTSPSVMHIKSRPADHIAASDYAVYHNTAYR